MEETEKVELVRRRRVPRWLKAVGGLLLMLLVALLVLWLMRFSIATDYIDREFERRGVRATYDVTRIGFGTQRIENLVIGDPARPDLTARVVELRLAWDSWTRPSVALITARGVRLRGRLVGGRLTLGEVDKLMPPPSGKPFSLPNQAIDIADASIGLETPAGNVGIGLTGRGNLRSGFRGHLAMRSDGLRFGRCALEAPRASVSVAVERQRPTFIGPVSLASARCGNSFELLRPNVTTSVTLSEAFNSWTGMSRVEAARVRAGANILAGVSGRLTHNGSLGETEGHVELSANQAAVARFRAARTSIEGDYSVSPRTGAVEFNGETRVRGFVMGRDLLAPVSRALRSAAGSPVGPVAESLAAALDRAGAGGADLSSKVTVVSREGRGTALFRDLSYYGRSGARLLVRGGQGISYQWPSGVIRTDGEFALNGGGFPSARFRLRQAVGGGAITGVGTVAPMAVGGTRLAFGEIRFSADLRGATQVDTVATIDGAFRGGRVTGLTVPIRGRFANGGFAVGESCVPASFRRLELGTFTLGATRLSLCPTGRELAWREPGGRVQGGAEIRRVRLAGQIGPTPILVVADRLRVSLDGPTFTGTNVTAELGRTGFVHRFQMAELTGRAGPGGALAGTFRGMSGKVANVPLLFSDGTGAWSLQRGNLSLAGPVTVADEREEPRFFPLVSRDFRLTLNDGRIHAAGAFAHPASGIHILTATIDHDLKSQAGSARIDVPGIRFALDGLQPEDITPLTVGAVALVDGTLAGMGEILWAPGETSSTGSFSTRGMNLAAAFGPVEGLTTTVEFTDLLNLRSAPGQRAHIDMIRAGIDVADGDISYQLLPNSHVQIESGRWPFAGGELLLQPTMLDFSQPNTRFLTFRVAGLNAERFTEMMGIESIQLTGLFDGVLPMEFDLRGGRIVGGNIAARPEGGTLSYVGVVSDESLGTYGRLAFDALRSLRYSKLNIRLDGALAGEFHTQIQLEGLTLATRQHWILRRFANLPFRFNIAIRGPLRAVISTTRAMIDPSLLIQPVLPDELRDLPTTVTTIDTEESETSDEAAPGNEVTAEAP